VTLDAAISRPATAEKAMPGEPVLICRDINKSYGPRLALRNLSFSLHAGRVLGFLGPNGAGKTTAIRVLTTVLEPTSGDFVVDGFSSAEPEQIRRRIGVLPEGLGFPRTVSGLDYLNYFGQLFGRPAAEAADVALDLLRHGPRKSVGLADRDVQPWHAPAPGNRSRARERAACPVPPGVTGSAQPSGPAPGGQAGELKIETATEPEEFTFAQPALSAPAGSRIKLTLFNLTDADDEIGHNWVLVKPGQEKSVLANGIAAGDDKDWLDVNDPGIIAATRLIEGSQRDSVTFDAPAAGAYTFVCTFPEHFDGGMRGTLTIE
jgi:azurin